MNTFEGMRLLLSMIACGLLLTCGAGSVHAAGSADSDIVHILKKGESIWTVSHAYLAQPERWRELQSYNGVRRDRGMPPGTPIRVPVRWLKRVELTVDVLRVSGSARWSRAGTGGAQALSTGARLKHGDRVHTESQSYVTLRLPEGSIVQISQGSDVKIRAEQYLGTDITEVSFQVDRGRIETRVVPRSTPSSQFEIRTPAAQLGVRGTSFRVALSDDRKRSTVEVEEGRVAASNHTLASAAAVNIDGGFGTIVPEGQPPLAPVPLLPAVDLRAAMGSELGAEIEQSFEAVAGAVAYRVQLATDAEFQQMLTESLNPVPRYRYSMLPAGRYHLRVRAVDVNGIEGLESRISFTVRDIDV